MKVSSKFVPFVVLILVALLEKQAFATTHVVGDSQGWDTSADLSSWASTKSFKIGDELEFKYNKALHSVVELNDENAYKNCDISTPLKSFSGGDNKIKLSKSGTRFFVCGTLSHCGFGMKIKITTAGDSSSSSSSSSSTTQPPSSPGATPTSASSHKDQFFSFFVLLVSLMVSFI